MDEHWVACDNCEGWVHQICGLFNKGRNTQEVPYLCPSCLMEGLRTNQRQQITVRVGRGGRREANRWAKGEPLQHSMGRGWVASGGLKTNHRQQITVRWRRFGR